MARFEDGQHERESCLLYNLCCDVGFSGGHWIDRNRHSDFRTQCVSYFGLLENFRTRGLQYQLSGSFTESLSADFLGSDMDLMLVVTGSSVIEDDKVCADESDHIYQTVPSKYPAYFRLKLLHIGTRSSTKTVNTPVYCVVDKSGALFLNGTMFKRYLRLNRMDQERVVAQRLHGPALTMKIGPVSDLEYDFVLSLHCRTWHSASREWIHRPRPYNWPPSSLIELIIKQGCELVPVGNEASESRDLEWRLSSSSAEKILVRSMCESQIQCYFLLKLVLQFRIKPQIPDNLCSYHMKTVMLHVVENTNPHEWREDNLTCCFTRCLHTLLAFLEAGILPQYFIVQQNLLFPKVQGETRKRLVRIVRQLYSEGWQCVLHCEPFTNRYFGCAEQTTRCLCFIQHWYQKRNSNNITSVLKTIKALPNSLTVMLHDISTTDIQAPVNFLKKMNRLNRYPRNINLPASWAKTLTERCLKCHIGYILQNVTRCVQKLGNRKVRDFLQAGQLLLEKNCDVDMTSCYLKLATFYFQTGKVHKSIHIAQDVLRQYSMSTVIANFDVYTAFGVNKLLPERCSQIQDGFDVLLTMYDDIPSLFHHVALPVIFSPWEISVPHLLFKNWRSPGSFPHPLIVKDTKYY